jgi:tRNA pseudouridine32 synthase/23S rRNA pseudouridine746 synthase/23S rRNA pseudouridine1911/1915/1917 synthase
MSKKKHPTRGHLPKGLTLLYEDKDILVVDKPAGMLTMGTDTRKTGTAYWFLTDYVKKGQLKCRNRIFIIHRLDQSTSGVLLFAKSETIKDRLQNQWQQAEKKYLAMVHGHWMEKEGILTSYLAENKAYVVYSTKDTEKGKLAQTAYKVLKEIGPFSLLEITLLTGRKNQIRVQMADAKHPVVGDKKYGKTDGDGYSHLLLHSKSISFAHPVTGLPLTFEAKVPIYFNDPGKKTRGTDGSSRQG